MDHRVGTDREGHVGRRRRDDVDRDPQVAEGTQDHHGNPGQADPHARRGRKRPGHDERDSEEEQQQPADPDPKTRCDQPAELGLQVVQAGHEDRLEPRVPRLPAEPLHDCLARLRCPGFVHAEEVVRFVALRRYEPQRHLVELGA